METRATREPLYDWTRFEIEAPDIDVEIIQYDVIVDMGAGTGTIWFDDFDLVPMAASDDDHDGVTTLAFEPFDVPGTDDKAPPPSGGDDLNVDDIIDNSGIPLGALIAGGASLIAGGGASAGVLLKRRRRLHTEMIAGK